MVGPYPYPESPGPGSPGQQPFSPSGGQLPTAYPGMLPPPVDYPPPPRRRRSTVVALAVVVVLAIAAATATIVFAGRHDGSAKAAPGALTQESAKAAIQDYLDALAQGKDERIAEHSSCGLFDAIRDRQADMALANLASDAFRRQFSSAQVTTIDKIVEWSPNQAQVLFTMKAKQARTQTQVERQAVAQLLVAKNETLVCSYLPRNVGAF